MKKTSQLPKHHSERPHDPPPQEDGHDHTSLPAALIIGGLEVTANSETSSAVEVATDVGFKGVYALDDVTIVGLWHLSRDHLEAFTNDGGSEMGRYGSGTYVGGGEHTGPQISYLKKQSHVEHSLLFKGNALFVPMEFFFDFPYEMAELHGLPEDQDVGPRTITDLLRERGADNLLVPGLNFDAVFFYGTEAGGIPDSSEAVVFRGGDNLEVVGAVSRPAVE